MNRTIDPLSSSLTLPLKNLLIGFMNICLTKSPVLSVEPKIFQIIGQYVSTTKIIGDFCNLLYYIELPGLNVFGTGVVICKPTNKKGVIKL